jgi:large subunit ribosomal protein L17
MRHRKKGRKLNRTSSHRKALLRNLANQVIEHKEIKTTTAKAKEARSTVERLITYAKKGDLHHRRLAFGFLRNKESIKILFGEIAPAFAEREGGYTRVLKLGRRQGDSASLSMLQLVGFEKLTDTSKPEKKKKARKKETAAEPAQTDKGVVQEEEVPAVQEAEVVEETVPEQTQAEEMTAEELPIEKEKGEEESPEEEKKK